MGRETFRAESGSETLWLRRWYVGSSMAKSALKRNAARIEQDGRSWHHSAYCSPSYSSSRVAFRHSASSWVAYTRKPPCRTNCWNILDVFGLSAGGFLHSLEELDAN